MKLAAALLLPILLAACSPVVYLTPAPAASGPLLPVEAQRVIDQATATAAAVATSGAQAATADWNTRATSTAARQATQDALGAQETEIGVQMTRQAVLDASTVTTAIRTQSARDTQAWATPTAAAVRTQAALDAATAARRQAEAESLAQWWATLRAVLVALVIVGGLSWIAARAFDQVSQTKRAEWAAKAEIARAAFQLLPPGHWAEYRPDDGYQVYPLPGLLDAPPVIVENEPAISRPNLAHAWRWRSACKRAVFAGVELGRPGRPRFGERDLAGADDPWVINADGSPASTGYRELKAVLVGAGVWVAMARKGTSWAPGWDERRFEREFDALTLPDLPAGEPPFVRAPIRSPAGAAVAAAPQAAEVVIDSELTA